MIFVSRKSTNFKVFVYYYLIYPIYNKMTGCRKKKIYYYSKDIYWVQATPSRQPGTGYSVVDQKKLDTCAYVIHSLKEEDKINR